MSTVLRTPFVGAGLPKVNLGGCALYLPLWRPDMACSTIISKDKYGHSCTKTGTVWSQASGTYFDGSDDKIVMPAHAIFQNAIAWTFLCWINRSSGGHVSGRVLEKADILTVVSDRTNNRIVAGRVCATGPAAAVTANASITQGTWYRIGVTWNDTTKYLAVFINGANATDGSPTAGIGDMSTDAGDVLTLGNRNSDSARQFQGYIDDPIFYTRILSASEIMRDYQAERWRH
jgi:hypothetical protein